MASTEHFNPAIKAHTVALFHAESEVGARLEHYIETKGYAVEHADDEAALLSLARGANVDVVVLGVEGGSEKHHALLSALREGSAPPPVLLVADRVDDEARACVARALVRPVPLAKVLETLEAMLGEADARRTGLAFAELLATVWRERRTGQLVITASGSQTTIHLLDGVPVFAEQDTLSESLGRRLLRDGRITTKQFSAAVDLITERMVDDEQLRLGEALVELGVLDSGEVVEALRAQLVERITACFALRRFHAELRPRSESIEGHEGLLPPAGALLLAGLASAAPEDVARFVDGKPQQRFYRLTTPFWEIADELGLDGDEGALLLGIDGEHTLAALRGDGGAARQRTDQLLCALALGGWLEAVAEPVGEQTVEMPAAFEADAHRKAAAERAAAERKAVVERSAAEKKAAADSRAAEKKAAADSRAAEKKAAADSKAAEKRARAEAKPSLREQLLAARDRLLRAPLFQKRPETAELRQLRLEAERAHQMALSAWRAGDLEGARDGFERAAKLDGDSDEYKLYAAWLDFVRSDKRSARQLGKLRKSAETVYGREPGHGLANLVLACAMRTQRRWVRAHKHLLIAQRADRQMPGLEAERKKTEQRREEL